MEIDYRLRMHVNDFLLIKINLFVLIMTNGYTVGYATGRSDQNINQLQFFWYLTEQ